MDNRTLEEVRNNETKLIEEIKSLEKQLEEINKMIEKCGFVNIEQVMLSYCGLIAQQKEFIKYLESEIDRLEKTEFYIDSIQKAAIETHKHNLSKYKEIIGE